MCRGNLSFLSSSGCGKKKSCSSRELWKEKEGTEWVTERERETFRQQGRYDWLWLSKEENTTGRAVIGK